MQTNKFASEKLTFIVQQFTVDCYYGQLILVGSVSLTGEIKFQILGISLEDLGQHKNFYKLI